MARKNEGGLTMMVDFSQITKFLGAGEAMSETVMDRAYQNAVLEVAYREANTAFNVEAAAAAATGANIKHMFEWGTQGVNTGRTNVRPLPNSERARLWHNVFTGQGLNYTLSYTFKPSFAIVPKPTRRDTGMDTETINSLRDHVFTWKAEVLETGAMVTIVPKEAKFLLIPYYASQHGSVMFSDSDIERGFTLSKGPHTHSPGDSAGTTGAFTTFWSGWWKSQGDKMINASIEAQIERDFMPAIEVTYSANKLSLPEPGKVTEAVKAHKRKVSQDALMKARGRRRADD